MRTDKRINEFWNSAYNKLEDGGYISDDSKINSYRFLVEKAELEAFIEKYTTKDGRRRALDVGCGNGRFSRVLSEYFDEVDAIDIAKSIIDKNIKECKESNIHYYMATLEEWIEKKKEQYDFIYIGGVLMYIDDKNIPAIYRGLLDVLKTDAILILRESVMTKKRVDNISKSYVAYYRSKEFYSKIEYLNLLKIKENLAYRVSELRGVLSRLKIGFLFQKHIYSYLLYCLRCKDLVWKPNLNKLTNHYYLYRKEKI